MTRQSNPLEQSPLPLPAGWSGVHAVALLLLAMASRDGLLDDRVIALIERRLIAWPSARADTLSDVLDDAHGHLFAAFHHLGEAGARIAVGQCVVRIRETWGAAASARLVADLQAIAACDGPAAAAESELLETISYLLRGPMPG